MGHIEFDDIYEVSDEKAIKLSKNVYYTLGGLSQENEMYNVFVNDYFSSYYRGESDIAVKYKLVENTTAMQNVIYEYQPCKVYNVIHENIHNVVQMTVKETINDAERKDVYYHNYIFLVVEHKYDRREKKRDYITLETLRKHNIAYLSKFKDRKLSYEYEDYNDSFYSLRLVNKEHKPIKTDSYDQLPTKEAKIDLGHGEKDILRIVERKHLSHSTRRLSFKRRDQNIYYDNHFIVITKDNLVRLK